MLYRTLALTSFLTISLAACGDGEEPCAAADTCTSDAGSPDAGSAPDTDPAPAIVSFTEPSIDHFPDDLTGFRFTVGPADVSVTELGFFDDGRDGLGEAHEVAIYDVATRKEIVRASVPAGTAATLEGDFRFVVVAS